MTREIKKPRSCGECGNRDLERRQFQGQKLHWDGEVYLIFTPLELWYCPACENVMPKKKEFEALDAAIETSKKRLTRRALEKIADATQYRHKEIARGLRISETYFSLLLNEKKNPDRRLYTQILRIGAAKHPQEFLRDPDPEELEA